jgi:hypothetical protein
MKFLLFVAVLILLGALLGYFQVKPERASVEMGDFGLKPPEDKKSKEVF